MIGMVECRDTSSSGKINGEDGSGGVSLYVNDQLEHVELHLGMDEELTKSLWVSIKRSAETGDIIVEICYSPPNQDDQVVEALYGRIHVGAALNSQALLIMRAFNHLDIHWRDNIAGHKQSMKLLECVEDNFLLQVTEKPTRRDAMLDFIITNKERIVGNVKLKGSLDHEMVSLKILRKARKTCSKLATLNFRRADWPPQGSA